MADLPKFIRQHFWENNWSRKCDLSKFPMSKLQEIAESFSNLDIKSKSAVIFTFANSSTPLNEEVSEIVEKVINMALADDNSYIRSAATVLQCRSPLNCLCFDLSDTNQEFFSTLNELLEAGTYNTPRCKILPMSEFFSKKVSNKAIGFEQSRESGDVKSGCLNSSIGFIIKGQTPADNMKDVYIEKLHEECERRRVHVPIPGRSFAKSETTGDTATSTTNNSQNRRAPSFPRLVPTTRKADLIDGDISSGNAQTTVPGSSARARLLAMHGANAPPTPTSNKSTSAAAAGRNGRDFGDTISRRPSLLGANNNPSSSSPSANAGGRENAAATPSSSSHSSTTAVGANKRGSKIKLLDFNDLPAIGIEAKRQKKEQQEKAREERRKQKEQEMEEKRQAREEARRAKLQASQAKKTPLPIGIPIQTAGPGLQHHLQPILQPAQIREAWSDVNQQPTQQQPAQQWMPFSVTAQGCNLRQGVIGGRPQENSTRQRQRGGRDQDTSASHQHSGGEDDDDEDDLEDGGNTISPDGTFAINAPRGFRGFAEALPSTTIPAVRQQQQGGTTILFQRPGGIPVNISGSSGQLISQMFSQQQIQPRFRLVRPWSTSTSTSMPVNVIQASSVSSAMPQQQEGSSATVTVEVSGQQQQRYVQMGDGLITLANTAAAAAQQQQSTQSQQPTVIIANPGARIQMAANPTHIQTAPGTPQPIIIRSPNLTPVSSTPQGQPQQTATFVISPSLPQVPIAQAPRLQPRLIQIRPRTPLSTATPTSTVTATNITSVARPNAPVPIILPAVSTGSVTVASGLQPQPRIIVANSGLRPVAPAGQNAQNQQHQQGYTRIIPRPPLAPITGQTTVQKHISSQPTTLIAQPLSREGLNLTPTQVTSIQSLFHGANRLSRLDKATILSFISGKAVNPQPESGTVQRIRLSEYRERVIDKETGNPMEVAVDTFLLLDYATGRFQSVKSYRTLPPDQLMALPVQPKVVPTTTTTTFVTTTSAS